MHLTSVSVTIQGYDLDLLLGQLEAAIAAKDYAALRATIADPFYSRWMPRDLRTLSLEEATDLLRQQYLGPGAVRLDFSEDPSAFIRRYTRAEQQIISAVYSTGWGETKDGEAFLSIRLWKESALGRTYICSRSPPEQPE